MSYFEKSDLKWYFGWLLGSFSILMSVGIYLLSKEMSWKESLEMLLPNFWNISVWLFLSLPFLLFLLCRYLFQTYRYLGWTALGRRAGFLIILPLIIFSSAFLFSSWYTQSESFDYAWNYSIENPADTVKQHFNLDGKFRGIHLFGTRRTHYVDFEPLVKSNIEWITLVPYGYMENHLSNSIRWQGRRRQSIEARDSNLIELVEKAKKRGINTIIKPHIWLGRPVQGKWRSDINFEGVDWESWSKDYSDWMLHYAQLSEKLKLPLFCIGTELYQVAKNKPQYWRDLISNIRKVYSGKITYAANWHEEYEAIQFWDDLDFIGIQAYFPLTKQKSPTIKELKKGWQSHIKQLDTFSKKYNKPILFTEIGYKSTEDAAIEPWEWANNLDEIYTKASYETQANCYQAFFETIWQEDWLAGALFWQWHAQHHKREDNKNINFTPQNKPAQNIMAKWFNQPISK